MINDAETGEFQAICCWDQDRFGRFDSIEAGRWIYPLRQAGVCLVTVNQGKIDWNDFASRMLFGIQQEAKHAYLRDLSRNVLRGLIARARRGEWVQGKRPPIGYVLINWRLALGTRNLVTLVRKIFREYLKGLSLQGLADNLNRDGIPAPKGGKWQWSTVRSSLTNVRYTGTFAWNCRCSAKYAGVRNGEVSDYIERGKNDPEDWIVIENNHPAIVNREIFDAVQRRLESQRSSHGGRGASSPNPKKYVLSGLVRCEKCGSAMIGHTVKDNQYSVCSGYLDKGASFCDRNSVRQDELVDHVVKAIEDEYLDPQIVEKRRTELLKEAKPRKRKSSRNELRRKLDAVDMKLTKAKARLVEVDKDMIPLVQDQIRALQHRREELKKELASNGKPRKQLVSELNKQFDEAIKQFTELRRYVEKADFAKLRDVIHGVIERITIKVNKRKEGKRHRYTLLGGKVQLLVLNTSTS